MGTHAMTYFGTRDLSTRAWIHRPYFGFVTVNCVAEIKAFELAVPPWRLASKKRRKCLCRNQIVVTESDQGKNQASLVRLFRP